MQRGQGAGQMPSRSTPAAASKAGSRGMERLTVIDGHARFDGAGPVAGRRRRAHGAAHLPQRRRPRAACRTCRASATVDYLTNTSMLGARRRAASTWWSSAAAISASSSRRCTAASAREVTVVEKGAAADRAARTRTCRRRSATILEDEGIAVRTGAECIALRAPRRAASPSASTARTGAPAVIGSRTCCSPSAAGPTPTTSGSTSAGVATDARGYIIVDDSLATQRAGHLGAGRLQRPRRVHAHRLQRLRDRRRQPARRRRPAGSATASRPTRSTSIRRSAASA